MKELKRQFQIIRNKQWVDINIRDIKDGDYFQIFDNGILYENVAGYRLFFATSDAYPSDVEGEWQIDYKGAFCPSCEGNENKKEIR